MSTPTPRQIDDLMERATRALTSMSYFEAELMALKALHMARRIREYERLARICMPLEEARRQRLMMAFDAGGEIQIIDKPFGEDVKFRPGCYLIQPMLVAADARRLRQQALEAKTPVAVLCREPVTQVGLVPIVALGEVVVRTKIRPPKKSERPDKKWFIAALEQLGDAAIAEIDAALEGERRVDALLDRLDAVPDHEKLHQRLAEAAHETARLLAGDDERVSA